MVFKNLTPVVILDLKLKYFFLLLIDTDSVVFRCKKGTATGLKIIPTIFGYWSREVDKDEEIVCLLVLGAKIMPTKLSTNQPENMVKLQRSGGWLFLRRPKK